MLLPEFQLRKEEGRTSNLNGLLTTGCLKGDLECGHLHITNWLSLTHCQLQDGGYPLGDTPHLSGLFCSSYKVGLSCSSQQVVCRTP